MGMQMDLCESSVISIDKLPGVGGETLTGLVIAKGDVRSFQSSKDGNNVKYVFSFTLRDAPSDTITVNIWGSQQFVQETFKKFQITDSVQVFRFQLIVKSETEEKYNPSTSSPYCIHVSEHKNGFIENRLLPTISSGLERMPLCKANDFYTLAEACTVDEQGHLVNLLACVQKVSKVEEVKLRSGKVCSKVQLSLFDETTSKFPLTIWNLSTCMWAQNWSPCNTVILVSNVRVTFNSFHNQAAASTTCKSVIICNPDTNEALSLFKYSQENAEKLSYMISEDHETLHLTWTVCEIAQFCEQSQTENKTTILLFGVISQFNIDCCQKKYQHRCVSCGLLLPADSIITCPNLKCPAASAEVDFVINKEFNMWVSISDHTGTIERCRINNQTAQDMLGVTSEEFANFSADDLTKIKWKWMLERCRFLVVCSFTKGGQFLLRVNSCDMLENR